MVEWGCVYCTPPLISNNIIGGVEIQHTHNIVYMYNICMYCLFIELVIIEEMLVGLLACLLACWLELLVDELGSCCRCYLSRLSLGNLIQ